MFNLHLCHTRAGVGAQRGYEGLGVMAQAQKPGFKLKALSSFSQSNFETGWCFQAGVKLAPPYHALGLFREDGGVDRGVGVQVDI